MAGRLPGRIPLRRPALPAGQRARDPDRPRRQRGARTARRLAVAAAIAATAILLPTTALAHASLVTADPGAGAVLAGPPTAITLHFSEAVTAAGPGLTVIAPNGLPAPLGPVRASGASLTAPFHDAQPGTYLVRWQVIAADTHPGRGQLTFSIDHTTTPPSGDALGGDVGAVSPAGLALQALARWLHLLGLALAFGVIAFQALIATEPNRRLDRLIGVGVGLLLLAEPVALAGQAISLGVGAGDVIDSSFGRVLGLRLGAALLLWAVRPRSHPLLLLLGAAIAVVDGLAGHRIAGLPDIAAYALAAIHESAMAIWLGGLAAVVVTRAGARAFAPVAGAAFATLVASGALLAFAHLARPADLWASTYGAILAIKLVAVAVAVLIAALSRRRLELMALAGVVALAALLTSLPPPR